MHPAKAFDWADESAMLQFVAATGWSRIFLTTPAGPRVAHAPMIVDADRRTLRFHLAKSNDLFAFLDGEHVLALFEGPHFHISANWYAEPSRHVPTWNYVAVECVGPVRRLDEGELAPLLDDLAAVHELAVGANWSRDLLEPARFEAMLAAIGAFEMKVTSLRGTRKLSQNQPLEVQGLAGRLDDIGATDLAALMRTEQS